MSSNNIAFVFPGQGSQKVGMLAELAQQYPIIESTFAQASAVLGYDLWALSQHGPQEELNLTECTQPLLLTASVAIWRLWKELGGADPALMAGHSLGEFSALVCSGVISFEEGVALVRNRGAYMQTAVPVGVGAMAAIIGLDDAGVEAACASVAGDECVVPVNYNSPGQVVIAGHADAVAKAIDACKAAGAKRGMPLPVSAPFHTPLMQPAGEKLAIDINALTFNAPAIPIVHNVHAKTEADPAAIKALMIKQIAAPVLWTSSIETMVAAGIDTVIECGAGNVASGLARRVHKPLVAGTTDTLAAIESALAL